LRHARIVRPRSRRAEQIRGEDDFHRYSVRAQAVVQNFGVIEAITGEALNKHMAWFTEPAREVSSG